MTSWTSLILVLYSWLERVNKSCILPVLVPVVNHCMSGFSPPVSMVACHCVFAPVTPCELVWIGYEYRPLMGSFISTSPKPLHLTQHQDFPSSGCVSTEPGLCYPPLLLGCTGASKAFCSCLMFRIFASNCLSLCLRSPPTLYSGLSTWTQHLDTSSERLECRTNFLSKLESDWGLKMLYCCKISPVCAIYCFPILNCTGRLYTCTF